VAPELSVTLTMSSAMLAVLRALTGNWGGNRVGAECLMLADALAVMRALVAQSPRFMLVGLMFMIVRSLRFSVLWRAMAEVSASSHHLFRSCRVTTTVLPSPAQRAGKVNILCQQERKAEASAIMNIANNVALQMFHVRECKNWSDRHAQ
jgi:hypothetical protein